MFFSPHLMHRCLSSLELRSNRLTGSTMEGQGHRSCWRTSTLMFLPPYSLLPLQYSKVLISFLLFFLFKQIRSCLLPPGNTSTANWLCLIQSLISASQASRINGKHPLRKSAALLSVAPFTLCSFNGQQP